MHVRHVHACSGCKFKVAPARRVSGCHDHRLARQALNHSSFQTFCFHRSKVLLTGHYVGPPQPIPCPNGHVCKTSHGGKGGGWGVLRRNNLIITWNDRLWSQPMCCPLYQIKLKCVCTQTYFFWYVKGTQFEKSIAPTFKEKGSSSKVIVA